VPAPTQELSSSRRHPVTKACLAKEIPESDKKTKKLCKQRRDIEFEENNFPREKLFGFCDPFFVRKKRELKFERNRTTLTNDDYEDVGALYDVNFSWTFPFTSRRLEALFPVMMNLSWKFFALSWKRL
jgi:hypothetical protein